jgi:inactivated superfamily I helicase
MPLEIARDLPLATTPDATVLRAIFDVMLGQWQREQLLRLINHVRVKGHVRNLSDLAQVARMERIRGGSGPADWMQRFDEVVERCAQEIELLGESSKALDVKTLERRKSMSERAAGALNALAQIVPTMSDEQITPAAFAALLDSIMKKLGIVSAELSERTSTYTAIGERHNISRILVEACCGCWISLED